MMWVSKVILKQKGKNYIPVLKHGESVQVSMSWIVNEARGDCRPRIAKSRSKSKNVAGTVTQEL
mgnify:CR=1 FL=1